MFSYDRSFTFNFQGDEWEAYLITEEEFKELNEDDGDVEDDAIAMVLTKKKCLFLTEGNVDKITIGHELYHMRISYLHLNSADLTVDQFEEVNAEFLGYEVDKFVRIRDELYMKFKELG